MWRKPVLVAAARLSAIRRKTASTAPMMTSIPAKILGIDGLTGSLQPGKRADLVIWSENPFSSFRAKVQKTLIAGKTVWTEGDAKKCYI